MKSSKKTQRPPRPPQRSELGRIWYEITTIEVQVKAFGGKMVPVQKPAMRFWLLAIGPQGRYTARKSQPFLGTPEVERMSTYKSESYVPWSDDAKAALNELLCDLWNEGWQPTSFGRLWYEITLRRVVPEPVTPDTTTTTAAASQESSAAASANQASTSANAVNQPVASTDTAVPQVVPVTVPAQPDAFLQAESNYARIRTEYAAGRINPDEYRRAIEELKVQDQSGRHWRIEAKSGKWITWDGTTWAFAPAPTQ